MVGAVTDESASGGGRHAVRRESAAVVASSPALSTAIEGCAFRVHASAARACRAASSPSAAAGGGGSGGGEGSVRASVASAGGGGGASRFSLGTAAAWYTARRSGGAQLPPGVAAEEGKVGRARASRGKPLPPPPPPHALDSRTAPLGMGACSDWAALSAARLAGAAFACAVFAGAETVGFVCLYFDADALPPSPLPTPPLRQLAAQLGGALFVQQAAAAVAVGVAEGLAASGLAPRQLAGDGAPARASAGASATPRVKPLGRIAGGGGGGGGSSLRRRASGTAGAHAPGAALPPPRAPALPPCPPPPCPPPPCCVDARGVEARVAPLRSWDACASPSLAPHDMHALLLAAFESFNLCAVFGLSSAAVGEFTRGAEAAMRCTNTFHNFGHVFNVAGTAWRMVAEGGCREDGLLCDLDVFALLCAAICHDLGHPGHTNAFELATCSDLSMLYNDRSVLENHHAAVGSALLRDTGLLDGLLPDERAEFRSLFLAAVLATDMAAHRQLVADVQARVGEAAPGRALRGGDLAGRTLAVAYILHAADLVRVARLMSFDPLWLSHSF